MMSTMRFRSMPVTKKNNFKFNKKKTSINGNIIALATATMIAVMIVIIFQKKKSEVFSLSLIAIWFYLFVLYSDCTDCNDMHAVVQLCCIRNLWARVRLPGIWIGQANGIAVASTERWTNLNTIILLSMTILHLVWFGVSKWLGELFHMICDICFNVQWNMFNSQATNSICYMIWRWWS